MIGRGAVIRPDLMRRIKTGDVAMPWPQLQSWIIDYYAQLLVRMDPRHAPGLLKKWLGMMRTAYPEAETLHRMLRTERDPTVIGKILAACQTIISRQAELNDENESIALPVP
jgi:tRNA-dihydrouridine synthase C